MSAHGLPRAGGCTARACPRCPHGIAPPVFRSRRQSQRHRRAADTASASEVGPDDTQWNARISAHSARTSPHAGAHSLLARVHPKPIRWYKPQQARLGRYYTTVAGLQADTCREHITSRSAAAAAGGLAAHLPIFTDVPVRSSSSVTSAPGITGIANAAGAGAVAPPPPPPSSSAGRAFFRPPVVAMTRST